MTSAPGRSAGSGLALCFIALVTTACAAGAPSPPEAATITAVATSATVATTAPAITTTAPATTVPVVHHAVPVVSDRAVSYAHEHHDYPAADLFGRCGDVVAAPVDGTVDELNRTDRWDADLNDPATRGGLFVSIVGNDDVRYYVAHLESIDPVLGPGSPLRAGDPIGIVGATGNAAACHVHFGLSFPCDNDEWWVRRGVLWPWPYLDVWRGGLDVSPIDERDGVRSGSHRGVHRPDRAALGGAAERRPARSRLDPHRRGSTGSRAHRCCGSSRVGRPEGSCPSGRGTGSRRPRPR